MKRTRYFWEFGLLLFLFSLFSTPNVYAIESFCDVPVKRLYKRVIDHRNIMTESYVDFVYFGEFDGKHRLGFCFPNGEKVELEDTRYKYDVSLRDRKLVLEDLNEKGPLLALAIAPGGLNLQETESVTPLFKDAWIFKNTAIEKRCQPSYFRCLPFIRVLTDKSVADGWTGIGMHIQQNPQLKRTFDSHGCIRLTRTDLFVADRILRYGSHKYLPFNVHYEYRMEEIIAEEPALHTISYQREKSFGGKTKRGRSGLVIFERVHEAPPIEKLYLD